MNAIQRSWTDGMNERTNQSVNTYYLSTRKHPVHGCRPAPHHTSATRRPAHCITRVSPRLSACLPASFTPACPCATTTTTTTQHIQTTALLLPQLLPLHARARKNARNCFYF